MRTMKGSVYFNPLDGGIWAFENEEGERFQLENVGAEARGEGRLLTVTGFLDETPREPPGLYPVLVVQSYTVEETPTPRKRRPAPPPPAR